MEGHCDLLPEHRHLQVDHKYSKVCHEDERLGQQTELTRVLDPNFVDGTLGHHLHQYLVVVISFIGARVNDKYCHDGREASKQTHFVAVALLRFLADGLNFYQQLLAAKTGLYFLTIKRIVILLRAVLQHHSVASDQSDSVHIILVADNQVDVQLAGLDLLDLEVRSHHEASLLPREAVLISVRLIGE